MIYVRHGRFRPARDVSAGAVLRSPRLRCLRRPGQPRPPLRCWSFPPVTVGLGTARRRRAAASLRVRHPRTGAAGWTIAALLLAGRRRSSPFIPSRLPGTITGLPTRRQRRPTPEDKSPPCPRRRQCPCRSGTGIQRRSPSPRPSLPSMHPLRCASSHPASSAPGTARVAAAALARWRGSAGWSCAGSQSRGSSGCP